MKYTIKRSFLKWSEPSKQPPNLEPAQERFNQAALACGRCPVALIDRKRGRRPVNLPFQPTDEPIHSLVQAAALDPPALAQ